MEGFSKKILELRKAQNWTQKQLADKAKCSAAAIGWYERGEKIPTFEAAMRLADALGVSLDALAGRSEQVLSNWGDVVRVVGKMVSEVPGCSLEEKECKHFVIDLPAPAPGYFDENAINPLSCFPPEAGDLIVRITPLLFSGAITKDMFIALLENISKKFDRERL
ncbi:MAG: helix-turn-helix transcriptional regulator [Clostridia bacterium]|nr:helix-turn-helix transcriptional regulator [Clostridia bacterium]